MNQSFDFHFQIMPSTNKAKAVFDHGGKTASYHIKSIADCQQSQKSSALFKLVLNRASGNKRYDFEAESPKLAGPYHCFPVPSVFLTSR